MAENELTGKERGRLQAYLDGMNALAENEPPRIEDTLTPEEYDKFCSEIFDYIQNGGNPPAWINRVTITDVMDQDGTMHKGFYDTAWEKWHAAVVKLTNEYHDVIAKALRLSFDSWSKNSPQSVVQILQAFMREDRPTAGQSLFSSPFVNMLNTKVTNDFLRLNLKDFTRDEITKTAKYTTNKGTTFTVRNYERLQGDLGTSAKKLLDAAVLYLSYNNYGHNLTRPTVEIPLIEYGEANGYNLTPREMPTDAEQRAENNRVNERIEDFKRRVRRDLSDIKRLEFSAEETKGRNKGDYVDISFISSHSVRTVNGKPIIRINFDVEMARYLINSGVTSYPTALLKHDNRNPNAYAIGRKIAFQNSYDNNAVKGTEYTLKVKTLLDAAPEIISIDALRAQGQRNWKQKIKDKLEKALDANVNIGYVIRWEYRDPRTGKTYTPETAASLSWDNYKNLDVDFDLENNPSQTERRERKAAEKAAAAEKLN